MIKAYHATSPGAFKQVLEYGALIPVGMRVDPEAVRKLCQDEVTGYYRGCFGDAVSELISELADNHVEQLRSRTMAKPVISDPSGFHMHCFEFITGGSDYVYLSSGQWESKIIEEISGGKEWGFVFNSEDLIRKGAIVITAPIEDLLGALMALGKGKSKAEVRAMVVEWVGRFWELHDRGPKALKTLKALKGYNEAYIAWSGPLSISGSIEIWRDGERVKELEAQYTSG